MDSHPSKSALQELNFALALGQQNLQQQNFAPVSAVIASRNSFNQNISCASRNSFSNLQAVNGCFFPKVLQQQNLAASQRALHQQQNFQSIFTPRLPQISNLQQNYSTSIDSLLAISRIMNGGQSQPARQLPNFSSSYQRPQLPIPPSHLQKPRFIPPISQKSDSFQALNARAGHQIPQMRKLLVNEQGQKGDGASSQRQTDSANIIDQNNPENIGTVPFPEHLQAIQNQAAVHNPQLGPVRLLSQGAVSCPKLPQAEGRPCQSFPGPMVNFLNSEFLSLVDDQYASKPPTNVAKMLGKYNEVVHHGNSAIKSENFADTRLQVKSLMDHNQLHAVHLAGKEQPILVDDDIETRLREAILWEANQGMVPPHLPHLSQKPALLATPRQELIPDVPKLGKDVPKTALLLHEFVRTLPPKSPCPFKTDIFMNSELFTKPKSVLKTIPVLESYMYGNEGWTEKRLVVEKSKTYRKYCVLNGYQKVELFKGKCIIEGFCTVWTKKQPVGWTLDDEDDEPEANATEIPLKKKLKTDRNDSGRSRNPGDAEDIVWQYSAMVTVEGEEDKIKCAVPKSVVTIEGVTYEVEPSWDDVVTALKEATRHREINSGWPLSRYFLSQGRIPPDFTSRGAVLQQGSYCSPYNRQHSNILQSTDRHP